MRVTQVTGESGVLSRELLARLREPQIARRHNSVTA